MMATPAYVVEQIARQYTRDRIRDADARRAARVAWAAARERQQADPTVARVTRVRRWWFFSARTNMA